MKKFIRMIDWRKFFKLVYVAFAILVILYLVSLANGRNVFPKNAWVVFGVTAAWSAVLLISGFSEYLMYLSKNKSNEKT